MAQGIQDWSTTAGNNGSADANINYAEGQTPASLNNSARAMMAALRAFYNAIGGGISYGGSGNTYTATNAAPGTWSAYAEGQIIGFEPNATNTGAATLNVDGLGAKSIVKGASTAVASGDLVSGAFYLLRYDGTNFCIVGSAGGGSYQPLDATLTALAALSYTSGTLAVTMTGADTFALSTFGTAAGQNTGTSGATLGLLNANKTDSGTNTFSGACTFSGTGPVFTNLTPPRISAATAQFFLEETDQTTDEKVWSFTVSGKNLTIRTITDAYATGVTALTFTRGTGTAVTNITSTAPVLVPAGSAAAPSLAGSGDSDTGIRFPGSNVGYLVAGASDEIQWTTTALSPVTNDGNALGTTALGWADIHLATGAVLNWANSDFTATHSTGALAFSGAISATTVTARVVASSETTGTLTSASANDEIYATGDITLPASVFVQGDKIRIYAGASARTITQGGGLTQRLGGTSTTGNLTLAARGWALVEFISATECTVSGDVS